MLLFRSSLSRGGGEANYDSFGGNMGGHFLPPYKLEIPPAGTVAPDPANFNGPATIGEYVTSCPELFAWLPNFNYPVNIPSNTLNLQGMFHRASSFNQPIKLPISIYANIPNVPVNLLTADLDSMFRDSAFNQPINNFPTYFTGESMFEGSPFNSPIDFSNSNAFSLERMFCECQDFNQSVEICNVIWCYEDTWDNLGIINHNDTSLNETFSKCDNFNSPVTFIGPNLSGARFFDGTFMGSAFNCPIDFSNIKVDDSGYLSLPYIFERTFADTPFNQPIVFPDLTSNMQYRSEMPSIFFYDTFGDYFNQPIQIKGNVIADLHPEFACIYNFVPHNFDQSVNISNNFYCYNFERGFENCEQLNHPINLPTFTIGSSFRRKDQETDEGECTISNLFSNCTNFNQPLIFNFYIDNYDIGENIDMEGVLFECYNFNAPITFNIIGPSSASPTKFVNINARDFFYGCYNFNPNLDLPNPNFLPNDIVDASHMFYWCTNFNVNHIFIPLWAENCQSMFNGCEHINHIHMYKTNDFNFDNLDLTGFLAGTSTNLKCEIITNGIIDNENYASPMTYEKVLEAHLFDRGPLSWINESWGSYNTFYNIYVIQDYNNYVNWTP